MIDYEAFPPQQEMNPGTAETLPLVGQLSYLLTQFIIMPLYWFVIVTRPWQAHQ